MPNNRFLVAVAAFASAIFVLVARPRATRQISVDDETEAAALSKFYVAGL